jgi:hypothetical protein
MNDNLKTNTELQQANIKCATAHSAWLRSTLDLNALGQSDQVAKEANDKRASAFAEYKRCQAEVFRISKMARLVKR